MGRQWRDLGCLSGLAALFALAVAVPAADAAPTKVLGGVWATHMAAAEDRLFFFAGYYEDESHGHELWTSRAGSTHMVRDIYVGAGDSKQPADFDDDNELLPEASIGPVHFFIARTAADGIELWRSNGSPTGTRQVRDIWPGNAGWELDEPWPRYLTPAGGKLFFAADDGEHGMELWRSDGTTAGTRMVRDINPGSASSLPTGAEKPNPLRAIGNTVLFAADNGSDGKEVWRSDGTAAGTRMVADIAPNGGSEPSGFTELAGEVFFAASNVGAPDYAGHELWKTDGTAGGTRLVRNLAPGTESSSPGQLEVSGGQLFFTGWTSTRGYELYRSDGTTTGTKLVKEIAPGVSWGVGGGPAYLTDLAGTLYFKAWHPDHGYELWRSDGTKAGTSIVKNLVPGLDSGNPSHLTAFGGKLYFAAMHPRRGFELWESDGTAAGTVWYDLFRGGGSSDPQHFTTTSNRLYVVALEDGWPGRSIWRVAP